MCVNFTVDVLIVVIFGGDFWLLVFVRCDLTTFVCEKQKKSAVLVGTTQKLVGMYFKCTRHSAKEN